MKKIFFAALAMCFICASCDNNGNADKGNGMKEKNIASSDAITKAFETGDVSKIDSVVAPDFLDHTDQGDKKGPDSLKSAVAMMRNMFKDMKAEKVKELADDEYVFTWMHYSGTSEGAMGMHKGPFSMNAVEVAKFKGGKAIEHWGFANAQDMMKLMGEHENMGNDMSKPDSAKTK